MHSDTTCEALNRLWIIHNCSLASYLSFAPPCWSEEDGAAAQLLHDIVRDQQQIADRVGKMIIEYGGSMILGKYPTRFTAMHDLSFQYMWTELMRYQQRTIDAIEKLTPQLPRASIAQALAQECLGVAKAHLDSLRDLAPSQPQLSA